MHDIVSGTDTGHHDAFCTWVADRIPWAGITAFGPSTSLGVISPNGLIAAVIYHDYTDWADPADAASGVIQISMAADSPMWARTENIRALLHYPFRQIGVWKVRIATLSTAAHNIKTFEHIGFKREAILADEYGRKQHAWVGRMRQPDFARLYEET